MVSQDIINVINKESETMIIEWADTQNGFGFDVIENELYKKFVGTKILTEKQLNILKSVIRNLFVQDMIIMEW